MPLIAADLVRVAAAVSLVAGTVSYGWLGFALFSLVLGGVMLPRAIGTPQWLDVLYGGVLLFGAWAAQLDWYVTVPWLDLVVHAVATGLIGVLCWQTLVRVGALPGPALDDDGPAPATVARPRLGAVVVTSALAAALAGLWEIGEWVGHAWIDPRIQVGYDDTVGDLAAGVLGAVIAGLLVARTLPRPGRADAATPVREERR
ncbi:hypothetical protein [Nocardioides campestrisoli]|uniref:hypothetical protein n=1 Tax=Nocardioides campestrisoli TaxID=2736757 RepID=UPI00163DBBAE|nr:hypothetical protein [Nocardioides campestrisoli]